MTINLNRLLRNIERLGTVGLALVAAAACGAAPEDGAGPELESVSSVTQPLAWGISQALLDEHHGWHHGAHTGLEFMAFHRGYLAKMFKEHRALNGDPSHIEIWQQVPNALRTTAHGWNETVSQGGWSGTRAQAHARILSNNPPFADENAFGAFVESTIHNWIHGAVATQYSEPLISDIHTAPGSTYFFKIHGMVDHWWSRYMGRKLSHTASSSNISGNSTALNHSFLNNRPNARVLITQNYGTAGPYNNHNVGVWYNTSTGRWNIFNEDSAAMPVGAQFNVQVEGGLGTVTTYNSNKSGNYMWFFHPLSNGNASSRTWATHNWNPPEVSPAYNNSPLGVWYTGSVASVFNQNTSFTMVNEVSFNIAVGTAADACRDSASFTHLATSSNTSGHLTYLSYPAIDGNSSAKLIVTPNFKFGGGAGTYNNHPIGVWYNSSNARWAVFNQDIGTMPNTANFNVIVQR